MAKNKTIDEVARNLDNLSNNMGRLLQPLFQKFVLDIYNDISFRSPVGKKDGGTYRENWRIQQNPGKGDVLYSARITNKMIYAIPLEYGSPKGGKPWPSAGPRTVVSDGRVWSSQMPEPVAGGALENADWDGLNVAISSILTKEL